VVITRLRVRASPVGASEEDLAEQLQEFVYGTVTALVVIGALDGGNLGSPRSATLVLVGTALATWLAHVFAALIGVHVRERRPVQHHEISTVFGRSWRIVTAAVPATAVLLMADLGWISLRSALSTATLLGVLQLFGVAAVAARRSQFTTFGILAYAATATAIGAVIVTIEIAVFH
jgi:hypothetical protein